MSEEFNKEATDLIHEHIYAALGRIEEQTTKTNGRVSLLEKLMWTAMGGLTIISFILGVIIF